MAGARRFGVRAAAIGALLLASRVAHAASGAPIKLTVDATEAPRQVLHARMEMPVSPGPLTLLYPKWIPGEHGPTGPINGLVGLQISADGKPVPWRRDDVELFAFHVDVPAGARALDVRFDFLAASEGRFSGGKSTTARLAVISWNQVLLYPQGQPIDALMFAPSLKLPAGWKHGTALTATRQAAGTVEFRPVSLETLVDSPVLTGAQFRSVELSGTPGPRHVVHIAADSEAALEAPPEHIDRWRALVREAGALFGARHYDAYAFLLTLSDYVSTFGLEHHQSSDNRQRERSLVDATQRSLGVGLFPHEFVHSWNGKHRRPRGLITPDYLGPWKTDLVWVYEGMTTYLGQVLAARSGLRSPEEARDDLALTAAGMDVRPGRTWRPLGDTAVSASLLNGAPSAWASYRRGVDYYPEMELVWLEVDALMRRESGGVRSLDDFCRAFFGGGDSGPKVVPYDFDDVVAALDAVHKRDWRKLLRDRLDRTGDKAPLGGLEAAGWKLVYDDRPSPLIRAQEDKNGQADFRFSLGATVRDDGTLVDVIPGMPAARAGLSPGMRLIAINGRRFAKESATALVAATNRKADLGVIAESGEFFTTHRITYKGGLRHPHLERIAGARDLLADIFRARPPLR